MSTGGSAALATLVCGMVHAPEKKNGRAQLPVRFFRSQGSVETRHGTSLHRLGVKTSRREDEV